MPGKRRYIRENPQYPWTRPENEEFAPAVNAADVKTAWNFVQRTRKQHPGPGLGAIAIGRGLWEQVLSPDANVDAVTYRASMLSLGLHFSNEVNAHQSDVDPKLAQLTDKLRARLSDDPLDDSVFKAIRGLPPKWMNDLGRQALPLDVEEFARRLEHNELLRSLSGLEF